MSTDLKLDVPPRVDEAERAILCAILLDNASIERVRGMLQPPDFYATAHQVIYREMLSLADAGEAIDNVVLTERLRANNYLGHARGAAYIAELMVETASAASIVSHARLVSEKAKLRRLQAQLIEALAEIDKGADLDRVVGLLPDSAVIECDSAGGADSLSIVTAASILEQAEDDSILDWLWQGMIVQGWLIGLIAKPKVGKSTWVYELAVKVALGLPFLGRATKRCGVLMLVLEEHAREVRLRLRALGADGLENLHLAIGSLDADDLTFARLKRTVEERSIGLIVVDTLNSFWGVDDENDAAQVTRAVKPLLNLARSTNVAIIAIHHARKSEGEYGDEIRGSGALFSLFDCAFILKRHESDTQRKLTAISRSPETPHELILELRDHGYESLGDSSMAGRQAKLNKLAEALSAEPLTMKELATRAGVALRSAHDLIKELEMSGLASRQGKGSKTDPFRFVACL